MPRTCHRDCLWIQNYFFLRYIALKTFWNDLKQYNIIKINVEGEIKTTGQGLYLEGAKKKKKSMQSLALLHFKCGYQGFIFQKKLQIEWSLLKPMGGLVVQCGEVFVTYFSAWEFIIQNQQLFPRQCPYSLVILRSVSGTKAQGKCSMDLAINVKASFVPLCYFVCLSGYLEM